MIMTMTGCGSSKGFTYLENADSISLAASRGLYDARIMPKDELTITVNTTDPDAAAPFNLQVRTSWVVVSRLLRVVALCRVTW